MVHYNASKILNLQVCMLTCVFVNAYMTQMMAYISMCLSTMVRRPRVHTVHRWCGGAVIIIFAAFSSFSKSLGIVFWFLKAGPRISLTKRALDDFVKLSSVVWRPWTFLRREGNSLGGISWRLLKPTVSGSTSSINVCNFSLSFSKLLSLSLH